jgi:hypothetical protein
VNDGGQRRTAVSRPDFIVIGAPKAGTTAVHGWLDTHPDVCVSRPKETQFFTLHHDRGPAFYERFFPHYAGEPVAGESTPSYLASPLVPARIASFAPAVRLIAILRDPAYVAFSAWWMMRSRGKEPRTFEQCIDQEEARGELSDDEMDAVDRQTLTALSGGGAVPVSNYRALGNYEWALERYLRHFDRDQLTVVFPEDLVRDPAGVVETVADAIGVRVDAAPSSVPARVNHSRGRLEAWTRRHHVPVRIPARARNAVLRATRAVDRDARPQLTDELRARLGEYYARTNGGLSELVGRDVSSWFRSSV